MSNPAAGDTSSWSARSSKRSLKLGDYITPRGQAQGYDGPLSHTFMVGHRRCTLTFDLDRVPPLTSTWTPALPRRLSKRQWSQYQAGRLVLAGYVADTVGGNVLIVEA